MNKLKSNLKKTEIKKESNVLIEQWKIADGPSNERSLYSKSPYYQHFRKLYEHHCSKENFGFTKNTFFCRGFIESVTKKYLSYIPIWSKIGRGQLSTNAYVENHFKNVKMLYIEEKNLKITRFIKNMYSALQNL